MGRFAQRQETADAQRPPSAQSSGAADYAAQKAKAAELRKAQKAVAQAEEDISRLEQEILDIEQVLAEVAGQSPENFEKYNRLKRDLEHRMYEWEILSEQLAEIE